MSKHTHDFVENYNGLIGFGHNRETNENTIVCYLQKFSDDQLMALLRQRFTSQELEELFSLVSSLLKAHLSEDEYHQYFLKDE
jgi:hypothetical protein